VNILVKGGTDSGKTYVGSSPGGHISLVSADDGSGRQRFRLEASEEGCYHLLIAGGTWPRKAMLSCRANGYVDLWEHDDGSKRQRWRLTLLDDRGSLLQQLRTIDSCISLFDALMKKARDHSNNIGGAKLGVGIGMLLAGIFTLPFGGAALLGVGLAGLIAEVGIEIGDSANKGNQKEQLQSILDNFKQSTEDLCNLAKKLDESAGLSVLARQLESLPAADRQRILNDSQGILSCTGVTGLVARNLDFKISDSLGKSLATQVGRQAKFLGTPFCRRWKKWKVP